jgi:hypothetical protein
MPGSLFAVQNISLVEVTVVLIDGSPCEWALGTIRIEKFDATKIRRILRNCIVLSP